jgi:hypothetical protein
MLTHRHREPCRISSWLRQYEIARAHRHCARARSMRRQGPCAPNNQQVLALQPCHRRHDLAASPIRPAAGVPQPVLRTLEHHQRLHGSSRTRCLPASAAEQAAVPKQLDHLGRRERSMPGSHHAQQAAGRTPAQPAGRRHQPGPSASARHHAQPGVEPIPAQPAGRRHQLGPSAPGHHHAPPAASPTSPEPHSRRPQLGPSAPGHHHAPRAAWPAFPEPRRGRRQRGPSTLKNRPPPEAGPLPPETWSKGVAYGTVCGPFVGGAIANGSSCGKLRHRRDEDHIPYGSIGSGGAR